MRRRACGKDGELRRTVNPFPSGLVGSNPTMLIFERCNVISPEDIVIVTWMIPIILAFIARVLWWIFYSQLDDKFISDSEKHQICMALIVVWPLTAIFFAIAIPTYLFFKLFELFSNKIEKYRQIRCKNSKKDITTHG